MSQDQLKRLERALEYISISDGGGELFPSGYSEADDAWFFLQGKGKTFLEAVEDSMAKDELPLTSKPLKNK